MSRHFTCTLDYPIVPTAAGKVRGFELDGTFVFQGIPYAYADRFEMPKPVEPWEGVFDALSYGYVAPLREIEQPRGEVQVPHRYWPMNEHCQNLNVWTQGILDHGKRPVMVWFHGGGFSSGSAIEHIAYDGENLSKFGDVVVVSVNHRLNVIGYLDMSPYDDKYWNSANVGNADLVASLQWVHDNIEAFGGDPDNVTIFGQSGGGMKVYSLMQTPAADGLYHKGIIMSGVADLNAMMGIHPDDDSRPLVEAMCRRLRIKDPHKLADIPYEKLAGAYNAVYRKIAAAGHYVGEMPMANEWYLGDPLEVGFREEAYRIPIMAGSVVSEFLGFTPGIKGRTTMTDEEAEGWVMKAYGDQAPALIEAFRAAYPDKPLVDVMTMDSMFREPTKRFIALKTEKEQSATYSYMYALDTALDDGKSPCHCSDIPFVFHNTSLIPYTNGIEDTEIMEDRIAGAYVAFARNGSPEHEGLPAWPACKPGDEATMILDHVCEVRHNHDHELIRLHRQSQLLWVPEAGQIQH